MSGMRYEKKKRGHLERMQTVKLLTLNRSLRYEGVGSGRRSWRYERYPFLLDVFLLDEVSDSSANYESNELDPGNRRL
jgi:hypothetical protein